MIGQGELFSVVDVEDDLVLKICKILGYPNPDPAFDWDLYGEIDDFVCDAVRDYIRRYWNE